MKKTKQNKLINLRDVDDVKRLVRERFPDGDPEFMELFILSMVYESRVEELERRELKRSSVL